MKFPESALAHELCHGTGIEIGGAAHNPFGLDTKNVDIVATNQGTIFGDEQTRLCEEIMPIDIIASGDDLPLEDESVDFVVSSHVLEHFTDPIKAVLEWDRVVRIGGIILMVVPHKERTFDKDRERTPLAHVVDDFERHTLQHTDESSGHEHVWITEDIVKMVGWICKHQGVRWKTVGVQDTDDKVGNGFCIAIRKVGRRRVAE